MQLLKRVIFLTILSGVAMLANAQSPLSVANENPYYFKGVNGKPLVLIGDYTWDIFSDERFDYNRLFDTLQARGLNLVRLWLWKMYERYPKDRSPNMIPYLRTGPGTGNDGKLKYDLDKFNPAFFSRLKQVCIAAQKHGIYLQLMLMDAWMLKHDYLWELAAYNRNNNINHVDGDPGNTGVGTDGKRGFCSMGNTLLYHYQQAYVRKVVKTVNGFDNVFFEIANENFYNEEWELSLGRYIKTIEHDMPKQHLVIRLDFPSHHYVVQSWDPATVHKKIMEKRTLKVPLIFDTDWTITKNDDKVRKAAWSAIASGAHFDFMDGYFTYLRDTVVEDPIPVLHRQIGYMGSFIKKVNLWDLLPCDSLIRKGIAFAMADTSILFAYLPKGGMVTLDLSAMKNKIIGRWYNPRSGKFRDGFPVMAKLNTELNAPDRNDWILLLQSH